jgi:hypothetical protein
VEYEMVVTAGRGEGKGGRRLSDFVTVKVIKFEFSKSNFYRSE